MKTNNVFNPAATFLYFMCVTLPVMFIPNPVLLLISLAASLLLYGLLVGKKDFLKILRLAFLPPVCALINALFYHGGVKVLFFLNDNPITMEALLYGFNSGIMLFGVAVWFSCFSLVMTGDKLLYVFGGLSPRLALILSMTLRYIPLFRRQAKKTADAQKALGLLREDNVTDRILSAISVFSSMVTWALENGVITADSMTARGYGIGPRSRYSVFRWHTLDTLLTVISLLCTGTMIYASYKGWLPCDRASVSLSQKLSPPAVISLVFYAVLALLPSILQIKEEIKWKFLRSAI